MTLLHDEEVICKVTKGEFFMNSIESVGLLILPGRLEVSSNTTEAILEFQPPNHATKLPSFLDTCYVPCRLVPNLAELVTPTTMKLGKDKLKYLEILSKYESLDLAKIQRKLLFLLILARLCRDRKFTTNTDLSGQQFGCAFLHSQLYEYDKPTCYWLWIMHFVN